MGRVGRTFVAIGLIGLTATVGVLGLGTWLAHNYPAAEEIAASGGQGALNSAAYRYSSSQTAPVLPQVQRSLSLSEPLMIPVAGVRPAQLMDTYTQARAGGQRSHDAIDIPAPLGTPVVAAASGRLARLFVSQAGGNTAYVRSLDGRVIYYYAHLDSYAPGLAEGRVMRRGDPIGTVGYSGNADPAAPHLHFAMSLTEPQANLWQAAQPINPYPLLMQAGR